MPAEKNPKISIIIPVYNDERFVADCVKSAATQTYRNLEIIIVDDGSTDGSPKICDAFSRTDSRIRVIHKENGGLSSARNAALDIAKGEYIAFLDSDDYLAPGFIETALDACRRTDSGVAIMKMAFVGENDTQKTFDGDTDEELIMDASGAIEGSLYQKLYSCTAPGKLYTREVIGDIRFPIGRVSEDLAVCHRFLDRSRHTVYINTTGYYYRQREKSIMHTFNAKRLDALEWTAEIEAFCKEKYPELVPASLCRTFNVAVHLALDVPEDDREYLPRIWKEVKRTRLSVLANSKARGREKAAAMLSFFGINALRKAWNSRYAVRKDRV